MKVNAYISMGLRVLFSCIAIMLIAIILLKPHTSFFLDKDSEAIEMETQVDEKDLEEENYTELDSHYLFGSFMLDSYEQDHPRAYNPQHEKSPCSFFNDIFLPPPEL